MTSFLTRSIGQILAGASVAALLGGEAVAQEPAAQRAAATGQVAVIEEIIVSARRRDESIQDTPIAMSSIAPSQLEGAAALTIGALQGAAPNVVITMGPTGSSAANISIRGIAFADIEKSFDPSVGVNVDGVYIGTSTGQMLDFFDVESIEVLRGPQGTLFGRNTIAGVINVRRTRPTGEWGGKFEVSASDFGTRGARAVLNVPIMPGVLSAKIFEMHQESDGYYRTLNTGKARGDYKNDNFGATFLLTPNKTFDALLTLEKQRQEFDPMTGPLSQAGDVFCPFVVCGGNNTDDIYTVSPGGEQFGEYSAPAATLEMNLDAGAVKYTSVSSYRESKEEQQQDYSSSGLYLARRKQKYDQFSQEFRGAGKIGDNFDYVAGLYYFDSQYRIDQTTLVFGGPAPAQHTVGTSESYAVFADLNWEIMDRVRLSGGGRWTRGERSMDTTVGGVAYGKASESWSKFTPKVGLDYRPTDDLMIYGSWSRGYRSGGFNGRGLTPFSATTPYDPETVDAFELGLKSEFLDKRASLNLAAFFTKYKDIQQSTTIAQAGGTGNETIVTNAASAKIQGIEADLTVRVTEGLTLRSAFGYTDAKFDEFLTRQPVGGIDFPVVFDFSDVDLIYAPKTTLSVNAEYAVPLATGAIDGEVKANIGYRYLSRYDQQIAADVTTPLPAVITPTTVVHVPGNDPRLRSDPQSLLDASLSFLWNVGGDKGKARVTAFGRNLLDDRGTNTAFTVAAWPVLWSFAGAREPRTYGVQLGYEF
jgi:iron complex outermembrane recepter protein